jgi:predicted ATPase
LDQPEIRDNLPFLGRLTGCREAILANEFLTAGIGCYDFPNNVLRETPQSTENTTGLSDFGANFLDVFRSIARDLDHLSDMDEIVAVLRYLNPSVSLVNLEMPSRNKVVITHTMGEKSINFPLEHESEGFRRFLAFMIALFQNPRKQSLIFEEPEKGIHPGALEVLAEQFKACPDAHRGQVILTTHSPGLLDHFDVENLRVVEIEDHVTKIGRVSHEQFESIKEELLSPGELLTVDPARIKTAEASEAS